MTKDIDEAHDVIGSLLVLAMMQKRGEFTDLERPIVKKAIDYADRHGITVPAVIRPR